MSETALSITPAISTQTFGNTALTEKHIWMAREYGFKAVEIYGVPPHFDASHKDNVHKISAAIKKYELQPAALHSSYKITMKNPADDKPLSLSFGNPQKRGHSLDAIKYAIDAAADIGTKIVVVHFGVFGDKARGDVLSNIISALILIEQHLEGTDVRIAFENVATPLSMSGYISYALEKFAFKNMGVCIDIGHANINEDSATAIENAGKRLLHIHASDNAGSSDSHLLPLEGKVDWKRVMTALKNANYNGYFVFEPRARTQPEELFPKCLEIFSNLMKLAGDENE